jgi:hypothetical protein
VIITPPGTDFVLVVTDVNVIVTGYPRWNATEDSDDDIALSATLGGAAGEAANDTVMFIFDDFEKFKKLAYTAGDTNVHHVLPFPGA